MGQHAPEARQRDEERGQARERHRQERPRPATAALPQAEQDGPAEDRAVEDHLVAGEEDAVHERGRGHDHEGDRDRPRPRRHEERGRSQERQPAHDQRVMAIAETPGQDGREAAHPHARRSLQPARARSRRPRGRQVRRGPHAEERDDGLDHEREDVEDRGRREREAGQQGQDGQRPDRIADLHPAEEVGAIGQLGPPAVGLDQLADGQEDGGDPVVAGDEVRPRPSEEQAPRRGHHRRRERQEKGVPGLAREVGPRGHDAALRRGARIRATMGEREA